MLLLAVVAASNVVAAPPVIPVTEAQLWLGDAHPTVSTAEPLTVELPDYWLMERRVLGSEGWYRLTLAFPPNQQQLALIFPNLTGRSAVFWQQQLLGETVPITGVGVPIVAGPLMVSIPPQMSAVGGGVIDLHFVGRTGKLNFVRQPFITTLSHARTLYTRKTATLVYLPVVLGMVSLVVAWIFFAAYRTDPAGAGFGWLTLGLAASALSVLGLYLSLPESGAFLISRLRPVLFHASFVFFLIAIYRANDKRLGPVARLVIGISIAMAVGIFVVPVIDISRFYSAWLVVSYAVGLYLLVHMVKVALVPPRRWVGLIPLSLVPLFILHDWIGILNGGVFWADQMLGIYNSALFAFALMIVLVIRSKQNARDLLALNLELEARVAAKHGELEQNFARMTEAERREAVLSERERMVREMHDGLGGQLVSTLAMVESGRFSEQEIEAALRDSLDDLRMMVHSLDHDESELVELLAMVRERIDPRLSRQDIKLHWHIGDVPLTLLSPDQAGHVLRVVQESFTNILKHAQARNIWVSATCARDGSGYQIDIADDGCGLRREQTSSATWADEGRGLSNMRTRAEQLGGMLEVMERTDGPGTKVCLTVPFTTHESSRAQ